MRTLARIVFVTALAALVALPASAAVVGNWSGSSRTWNSADMSNLKGIVTTAGHTVLADAAIVAGLGGATVYVVGEGGTAPTAGELTILNGFVTGGGRLLLLNDSSCSGCTASNAILTALGSAITVSGASASVAAFPTSPFTVSPNNLVGLTLDTSPGSLVAGGTQIAGSFISYQQLGTGYVIVTGDRSDHNIFNASAASTNAKLFLNILGGGVAPTPTPTATATPIPAAIPVAGQGGLLLLVGLLALAGFLLLRAR